MNIYVVERDPVLCAQAHMDRHISQSIVQTAQMLSAAWWVLAPQCVTEVLYPYGMKYVATDKRGKRRIYGQYGTDHPHSAWTRATRENYVWLHSLGRALVVEFYHRFGKVHASSSVMKGLQFYPRETPEGRMTPHYLEMPGYCMVQGDAVASYRKFYNNTSRDLVHYTNRQPPCWLYTANNH